MHRPHSKRRTADLSLEATCDLIVEAAADPRLLALEGVRQFPGGMCTWMSFAGGELLRERGFGTWTIWNAATEEGDSHHDWLVQGELYVDFTAHQFPGWNSYLLGTGANPVASRYPRHKLLVPTSRLYERKTNLDYKLALADVMHELSGR